MTTKHTYTATAQDGTVHTRTTARTYTHCIVAGGIHHSPTVVRDFELANPVEQYDEAWCLGWAGSPELAAKRVAGHEKAGFLNVEALPCTVN